jgi:alginate O-acetyltransferase complex protein AlgJ
VNPKRNLVLCFVFLAGLLVPTSLGLFHPSSARIPKTDQEPLPMRPWMRSFPKAFEKFFDSHLGGRLWMVQAHHLVDVFAFGVSPTSSVIMGKHGWAFLHQDYMPESLAGAPFSESQLEQWLKVFQHTQRSMSSWNGKLLVVVAPNKATIYPENLPDAVRATIGTPRLDAFNARLRQEGIEVLDLRLPLKAAKQSGQLYAKRDTHWMGQGVLAAAESLAKRVAEISGQQVAFDCSAFSLQPQRHQGDLATMMALSIGGEETINVPVATVPIANPTSATPAQVSFGKFVFAQGAVTFENKSVQGPRVLIFHDSFGQPLKTVVPHLFGRSTWIYWTGSMYQQVIDREKPDVVVYLTAERYLHRDAPVIETDEPN